MKSYYPVLLVVALISAACGQSATGPDPLRSSSSTSSRAESDSRPVADNNGNSRPSDAPLMVKPNGTGQYHDDGSEPIVFDWTPTSRHVVRYRVEMQRDENNKFYPWRQEEGLRTFTVLHPPGLFRSRIRAEYSDGVGAWGEWFVYGAGKGVQPPPDPPSECYTNPDLPFTIVPCEWYWD